MLGLMKLRRREEQGKGGRVTRRAADEEAANEVAGGEDEIEIELTNYVELREVFLGDSEY